MYSGASANSLTNCLEKLRTTAGYRNTFSYDKLIQLLVRMVTKRDGDSFILGASWRVPVLYGLQAKTFLQDLKNDPTFEVANFEREYESKWTGVSADAFFDGDRIDGCRTLQSPEFEGIPSTKKDSNYYYAIGADIGRKGDLSEFTIVKVVPRLNGKAIKELVNLITLEGVDYREQAITLKQLYYKYKARTIVIDANGPGIGLIDFLWDTQVLPDGVELPPFGVINDPDGIYKKKGNEYIEKDALYLVKANAVFNTECHVNLQSAIMTRTVRFLISAKIAKEKLLMSRKGQLMSDQEKVDYLYPFNQTDMLRDQLLNLREETEGINIKLKQANQKIKKDKFSSLEYVLWWIKQEEDANSRRRKRFKASDWMLMN